LTGTTEPRITEREWGASRRWSAVLVSLVLTANMACRGANDRFLQVRNGMSEVEVTSVAGQPTSIFNQPFPDRYRPTLSGCDGAVKCYVYDRGEKGRFLVYFDGGGRSVCHLFSQELSPTQR
jgi:hypothetical protein